MMFIQLRKVFLKCQVMEAALPDTVCWQHIWRERVCVQGPVLRGQIQPPEGSVALFTPISIYTTVKRAEFSTGK